MGFGAYSALNGEALNSFQGRLWPPMGSNMGTCVYDRERSIPSRCCSETG